MKKKNTILYLVILGAVVVGGVLGIVVNLLMGVTLAQMFASTTALTIYIALGTFFVIFLSLLLLDWGKK